MIGTGLGGNDTKCCCFGARRYFVRVWCYFVCNDVSNETKVFNEVPVPVIIDKNQRQVPEERTLCSSAYSHGNYFVHDT
jgi:hypothetical protein